jgi:hypothetical protein
MVLWHQDEVKRRWHDPLLHDVESGDPGVARCSVAMTVGDS